MSVWVWIGVALLGGGGSLARFMLDGTIGSVARGGFPLGTFTVNASGALLLGLLSGAALTGDALVLAGSATLGSYTTFSTWMLESQRLAEDAEGGGALLNIALSLAVGIGAAALGHAIGVHL
ncbi:MAG TPA: fluoride efflux transporter CrcB [Solirubrobacteraceae bacterium]|nr:fluoride efflux transporter CrcB [Solirubrobacteraceae bacterium]